MELEIRKIKNAGTEEEYLILRANADCNTGNFLVFDETYDEEGIASNKFRHLYIFPSHPISQGDFIWLYTHKEGEYATHNNTSGTITHKFYWGINNSIWNHDGDKVYVVHFDEWIMKTLEAEE